MKSEISSAFLFHRLARLKNSYLPTVGTCLNNSILKVGFNICSTVLYVCMFYIVTVVRVHVLYCDSCRCACLLLWQLYVCMFCIVTVVRVHVFYCDSCTCACFVLWQLYERRKYEKHCPVATIKRTPSLMDGFSLISINFVLSYIWDVSSDTSGTVIFWKRFWGMITAWP